MARIGEGANSTLYGIRVTKPEVVILVLLVGIAIATFTYGATYRAKVEAAQPNMRFELLFYEAHAKPNTAFEVWRDKQTGQIFTCTIAPAATGTGYGIRPCFLSGTSAPDKAK